jgi:PAS domain S-box-containing protein
VEGSAELELQRFLQSQHELARQLLQSDSLEEAAPGFIAAVARLLRWEAGAVWEVEPTASELRFVCGWDSGDPDAEPLWRLSRELGFQRGTGLPGRAWEKGEITWLTEVPDDSSVSRRRAVEQLGLEGALAIPVPIGAPGSALAVAEFFTRTFSAPSEQLLGLLEGFTDQLAMFISRRRAEVAMRASEELKSAVLASSMDCIVSMDDRGFVVEFNDAAERTFGYRREDAIGRELGELIVPADLRERHRAGLRRYLQTGEAVLLGRRVELSAMRSDGSLIPVEVTVTRIAGSGPPMFTGFLRDISARAEVERVRNHLAAVVYGTQDAVLSKDLDGVITAWNPAAERLYGYTAAEAVGRNVSFLIPSNHEGEEQRILEQIGRGDEPETYETERVRKDGVRIDVSLTASPIANPVLGVVGASVVARDVTAEKRRRRAQEFLAAASRALDLSLDVGQTARTIVRTAVPDLAELCVIDFVRDDGRIGDSVVAATDPDVAERLEAIRRDSPLDPDGDHPVAQVLRSGRPTVWRDLKRPDVVDQVAQTDEHRDFMAEAGYTSAAVVAMVARGRTLGTVSFLHTNADLRYDSGELDLLRDLANRAAMALDNARLYQERDRIARSLQRGLRPPRPAEVPGLEISVVFEAAGEGIEIGGDLYDVLPTDDGCWILIGDVAGKGSEAASVSVALRHSVRGLTRELREPGELLRRVNHLLLEGTGPHAFATAMLLRMRRSGDGWSVSLAGAGHPPAVHVFEGGAKQLGGGSILGGWPDSPIERHEVWIGPGETLVLYTDGWLEVGPPEAHRDPQALADLTRTLADRGLEELTDSLRLDAVSRGDGTLRDDLVVLAIRPGGRAVSTSPRIPLSGTEQG